jgi:large subunit ribosomal protein L25
MPSIQLNTPEHQFTPSNMAAMERHIRLAQDLHPRLLRFFTRFPPSLINGATQPSAEPVQIAQNTSSMNPNATSTTTTIEPPSSDVPQYPRNRNPFLAFKNPNTGNWHAPHYSLRRQAELFKLAKEFDVLPLMPHSPKHPEIKEQKRIENGSGNGRREDTVVAGRSGPNE